MASAQTRTSRCFIALAVVFGVASAAVGPALADPLYLLAMLQLVVSTVFVAHTKRLERGFLVLVGLVGICYLAANLTSSSAVAYEAVVPALFALMGTVCIIAAVGIVLGRRRNGIADGVVGDALIVGLGAWILSWVFLVQPVASSSTTSIPAAVLFGFTQPASCVLMFMLATLIFTRLERPPALWLLTAALFCSLTGDLVYALMGVGLLAIALLPMVNVLYILTDSVVHKRWTDTAAAAAVVAILIAGILLARA